MVVLATIDRFVRCVTTRTFQLRHTTSRVLRFDLIAKICQIWQNGTCSMKIAVTGATGFLGRYVVQALTRQQHACRCWYRPDRNGSGFESHSDFEEHAERFEWIPGRLGDVAATAALVTGCDAVVHAALMRCGPSFRGGEGDLVEFVQTNLLGTLQLIEAAQAASVSRFVFVSTCAVHERILPDRPLDETHPLWPASHYGAHKAAIEKFVHSFGLGTNYPICAVRPTGIYGLARPVEQSKWYDLVSRVARGEDVTCEHGGKEVHAADVARAISLLLLTDNIAGEVYNCYDMYVSEYDVAHIARKLSGQEGTISGERKQPRHQIETGKLRQLGMEFGGTPLLTATIQQIVDNVR